MSKIYCAYFGFKKEPFATEIAIKDILVTNPIQAVYDRFTYVSRLGAICVITGEVGAGKSTALRWSSAKLQNSKF